MLCRSFDDILRFLLIALLWRIMPPKFKDGQDVVAFSGAWVSWAHTVVAYAAFIGALITGLYLHYHKIVENEYYVCASCRWILFRRC